jgi:hypothetical protein
MQVQIVKAPTRQKVMDEAKRRFGEDPLVLSVKRKRGPKGQSFWEAVIARDTPSPSVELEPAPTLTPSSEPGSGFGWSHFEEFRRELASLRSELANGKTSSRSDILALAHRLTLVESEMLGAVLSGHSVPPSWYPVLKRLEDVGYPKAEALRVLSVLHERVEPGTEGIMRAELRSLLGQGVEVAPSQERVQPGLVVFAGAAGVGKTTLAAKLAADLSLGGTAPPVLGVLRPRKGAGTEVVRRCARTLGLEFVQAQTPQDVADLGRRALEQPVILDSSSINPFLGQSIEKLSATLAGAPDAEVHAVVPSSYGEQDFFRTLNAFVPFPRLRLSVTGLDEAPFVGRVLAASTRTRVPVGYFSLGPRIPDDLARPSVEGLVDSVVSVEGSVVR